MKKTILTLQATLLTAGCLFVGCGGGDEEPNPLENAEPPKPGVPDLPPDEGE